MYALHARNLRKAHSLSDKIRVISDLVTKLKSRRPSDQEFEANFRSIQYSDNFTRRKTLVQYIFTRMNTTFLEGVAVNPEKMTIEHIAPQNAPTHGPKVNERDVAEIGNLLFVSDSLNGKLKNKPFAEKIKILKKSHVWLDDTLKTRGGWQGADIHERSDHLADLAYKQVWSL